MRKFLAFVLVVAMSSYFATGALAADGDVADVSPTVFDYRKLPHKDFSPQQLNPLARADGPTDGEWVANIEYNRATSDSYWNKDHSIRWPIDVISAYYRAYNGNSLEYSDTDIQENASHAAAGYEYVWADEIIGQHYFEQAGYQSWQVETYY